MGQQLQQTDSYDAMSTQALADYVSDYHKDFYGFRFHSNDREELLKVVRQLDSQLHKAQSTPEGRAELRLNDWIV
jgi:hypothetical protein